MPKVNSPAGHCQLIVVAQILRNRSLSWLLIDPHHVCVYALDTHLYRTRDPSPPVLEVRGSSSCWDARGAPPVLFWLVFVSHLFSLPSIKSPIY